jgi:uncharacterized protein YjdB
VLKKVAKLKSIKLAKPTGLSKAAFKKSTWSLKKGNTYTLKWTLSPNKPTNVTAITFTSSKKSVVMVDAAGQMTALKKGKATITIKAAGKKVTKKVQVK